jgi:hypothetical protein
MRKMYDSLYMCVNVLLCQRQTVPCLFVASSVGWGAHHTFQGPRAENVTRTTASTYDLIESSSSTVIRQKKTPKMYGIPSYLISLHTMVTVVDKPLDEPIINAGL